MPDDTSKIAKNLENLASLMTTFSQVIIEQTKATQEQTAAFREQSKKLEEVLSIRKRIKDLEDDAHRREVEDGKRNARLDFIGKYGGIALAAAISLAVAAIWQGIGNGS